MSQPLRRVGQLQKQPLEFPIPNFSLLQLANTKAKLFALFEGHSVPADLLTTWTWDKKLPASFLLNLRATMRMKITVPDEIFKCISRCSISEQKIIKFRINDVEKNAEKNHHIKNIHDVMKGQRRF